MTDPCASLIGTKGDLQAERATNERNEVLAVNALDFETTSLGRCIFATFFAN